MRKHLEARSIQSGDIRMDPVGAILEIFEVETTRSNARNPRATIERKKEEGEEEEEEEGEREKRGEKKKEEKEEEEERR